MMVALVIPVVLAVLAIQVVLVVPLTEEISAASVSVDIASIPDLVSESLEISIVLVLVKKAAQSMKVSTPLWLPLMLLADHLLQEVLETLNGHPR